MVNTNYHDIIEKCGNPLWWDESAVPRYCSFAPDECGVYNEQCALIEIECQDCATPFQVVVTGPSSIFAGREPMTLDVAHYGDPPIHNCVGDTMSSDITKVIEWWERDLGDWHRVEENEKVLVAP